MNLGKLARFPQNLLFKHQIFEETFVLAAAMIFNFSATHLSIGLND